MNKKVMIVDDSASMRLILRFTLNEAGYDVVEAVDGKDALDKLGGEEGVSMIIADMSRDAGANANLVRHVRQLRDGRMTPVLVVTIDGGDGSEGDAYTIVKPFKPYQLVAAVRKAIGQ